MRVMLLVGLLVLGLASCQSDDDGSGAEGDAAGDGDGDGGSEVCSATAPTACPSEMPTYADVEPIFQERCVTCHQGPGQSELCPICWALLDYDHIVDWKDSIRTAMLACEMPPPSSGITMTNAERMRILEWLRCGAPE